MRRWHWEPVAAILVAMFLPLFIPFGLDAHGTWRMMRHEGGVMLKVYAVAFGALAGLAFVAASYRRIVGTWREKRLLKQRGEQSMDEFAGLFAKEQEWAVAQHLYPILQSFTFTEHVPLLKEDSLEEGILVYDDCDIAELLEYLSREFDVSESMLEQEWSTAVTVGGIVEATARAIERWRTADPSLRSG